MDASVATYPSMVAMLGRIIPDPLAIPVMVTMLPLIRICLETAFGTISVVMIDPAASNQLSDFRLLIAVGSPAITFSRGSCSMMTPVEKGKT